MLEFTDEEIKMIAEGFFYYILYVNHSKEKTILLDELYDKISSFASERKIKLKY